MRKTKVQKPLAFSHTWSVFGPLSEYDPRPSPDALATCPARLRIGDKTFGRQKVGPSDGKLDLRPLFGRQPIRAAAWVFLTFRAPKKSDYRLSFGADCWFEVFIDGKPLTHELLTGYNPIPQDKAHPGKLRLNAGVHVVAIRVLAGSNGFAVTAGEILAAEEPRRRRRQTVIDSWLVFGSIPFAQGEPLLSVPFLPEESLAPSAGDQIGTFTWFRAAVDASHALDFNAQPFAHKNNCVAYAFTYIHAARACTAKLQLGASRGLAVWVNGQQVWAQNEQRPLRPREDVVPVQLEKGWNRLLCKASQTGGPWSISCVLETPVPLGLGLANPYPERWRMPRGWGSHRMIMATAVLEGEERDIGFTVFTCNCASVQSASARLVLRDDKGGIVASVLCAPKNPFGWRRVQLSRKLEPLAAMFATGQATLQLGETPPQFVDSLLTPDSYLPILLAGTRGQAVSPKLARLGRKVETAHLAYPTPMAAILPDVRSGLAALATQDHDGLQKSLENILVTVTKGKPDRTKERVTIVGHAHIDMNWLWTYPETVMTCQDTFRQVLALMDQYPDFGFLQSQPSTYRAVEAVDAPLFTQIRKRVREGRWELAGGMWTEGDTNLSSGEALARSFLLGQRYFLDRFGKCAMVGWLPDNFGHVAQLPQLLRLAGCEFIFAMRCTPYKGSFHLESPDGSQVLCFSNWNYNGTVSPTLAKDLTDLAPGQGMILHSCGTGDHGGGPTRQDIEMAARLNEAPNFPAVRFGSAEGFFRSAEGLDGLPLHQGEMQYIFEGCYTTIARVKQGNRRCETTLAGAEFLACLRTLAGETYPAEDLRRAWEIVTFNQFHDILCGSAIHESNADALADYKWALTRAESLRLRALRRLADEVLFDPAKGQPIVVMNTAPRQRRALVEAEVFTHSFPATANIRHWGNADPSHTIDLSQETDSQTTSIRLRDAKGREIPAQVIWGKAFPPGFRWKVQFVADELPAGGYQTYYLDSSDAGRFQAPIPERQGEFETDDFKIAFDLTTGDIRRLYDKRTQRELAGKGGLNVLKIYLEKPHGMSAWTLGPITRVETVSDVESVSIIERGPVRACVEVVKRWGRSKFIQRTYVYRSYPRIDFELDAHWFEQGTPTADAPMLRVVFPLALDRPRFVCHTPFAAVERPTTGREVPAQQWVDASDGQGGVALLTEAKYGYALDGNELRLTLLRSSYDPDIYPDQGLHRIRYAFFPHAGDWKQGVWSEGESFCSPPLATEPPSASLGRKHATRPEDAALISLSPASVMLSGLKQAEDGHELVVRVVETTGHRTQAALTLPAAVKSARRLDLIERPLAGVSKPRVTSHTIRFALQPYEIVTLGLVVVHKA